MGFKRSPAGRKYDRHIPAPLPHHMMLNLAITAAMPLAVTIASWDGPIKDQGPEGSCTGHAFSETLEWIARRYFPVWGPVVFSPQFLYAFALIVQGSFPADDGSDGETLCKAILAYGCCELALYPYVPGQILHPTPNQVANASKYRLGAYHGLSGSETAASVLGDPVPWPVNMGFTVYESFESDAVAKTGVVPVPDPSEQVLGGHEVKLSGYDLGAEPTLRPAGCPPAFLVQNSWGTDWGLSGYCWIPTQIVDAADTDLKIVHSGHPWK